uniref:Retinoic acid receptor alpha-like n=1 Tax=Crassostrea virginica TaxID=6565 RepID=A0A8B8DLM2_CRAVI|nr:retinoic acid receptor alpha-like [Crassostrea virginica]XP_022327900.1 retinoic acid receptor alpha-like [Crassostrea virginica]XP_022327909.1 retinoic acid receptor alpha-like [Crassostrea virginica]
MLGNEEHPENEKETNEKPQKAKKKRNNSKERLEFPPCKVCSGNATGIHYGVYTCEPCKAFFRRAITDKNKYACPKENNCEITAQKRGNCSACRLQKCFDLGMSKSAVRQGRYTIELRTNTILEVKRLANKNAVEVSIDAQKDKSNEPISQEPSASAGTGPCPMETEEESVIEIDPCVQSQLESLEPTSEMPVDMALSLLSAENDSKSLDSNLPPKKKVRLRDPVEMLEECVVTPGVKRLSQVSSELEAGPMNVSLSEKQIQCLIQTLVKAHDTIYPNFKKYFEKEHQQYLEEKFLATKKMQEDVFGIKSLLDKEEFEKVYRATGIDVDGRLEFLKKIYSHRERSLMKFITFAKCVEGFSDLSMNDKINLVKHCEHEYWVLGHFTHYHPELNATIGHEIQVSLENNEKIFGQPSSEELLKMFCSLKNMDFRYQEVIILRGIVLFSRDRCELEAAGFVESVQWKLIQCLQYLLELFHPDEPRKFSQCLQLLTDLRGVSEKHHQNKRKQYEDYTLDIIKECPLIYEALEDTISKLKDC